MVELVMDYGFFSNDDGDGYYCKAWLRGDEVFAETEVYPTEEEAEAALERELKQKGWNGLIHRRDPE